MRIIRRSIPLVALCLTAAVRAQHSPLTSQYLFNGLTINPAYAGSRDVLSATLTHRQQWVGFDGAPVTQMASVHAPVKRSPLGLGLVVYNDRIGVTNESGILSNYAYRIRTPRGKLALGVGAGLTVLRANWTEVSLQQTDDAAYAGATRAALRPNFSAGALYQTKTWFLGASVPFLVAHRYDPTDGAYRLTNERISMQPMLTGGWLMKLNDDLKLKPSALLRYRLDSGLQGDLSTNVIYKDRIWLGVSYRTRDAVIGMLEVLPTPQWRLGYAYDLGISALRPYHRGTHELLVQYEFGYRIRVRDPRYF